MSLINWTIFLKEELCGSGFCVLISTTYVIISVPNYPTLSPKTGSQQRPNQILGGTPSFGASLWEFGEGCLISSMRLKILRNHPLFSTHTLNAWQSHTAMGGILTSVPCELKAILVSHKLRSFFIHPDPYELGVWSACHSWSVHWTWFSWGIIIITNEASSPTSTWVYCFDIFWVLPKHCTSG